MDSAYIPHMVSARFTASLQHSPVIATITLTSNVDGRQAACPGEVVTYTCTMIQGAVITWTAAIWVTKMLFFFCRGNFTS